MERREEVQRKLDAGIGSDCLASRRDPVSKVERRGRGFGYR